MKRQVKTYLFTGVIVNVFVFICFCQTLPESITKWLKKNYMFTTYSDDGGNTLSLGPSWETVDLNNDGVKEYIVYPLEGRGASGNGYIFVFQKQRSGYKQVGELFGVVYYVQKTKPKGYKKIITCSHESADYCSLTVYVWYGDYYIPAVMFTDVHRYRDLDGLGMLFDRPAIEICDAEERINRNKRGVERYQSFELLFEVVSDTLVMVGTKDFGRSLWGVYSCNDGEYKEYSIPIPQRCRGLVYRLSPESCILTNEGVYLYIDGDKNFFFFEFRGKNGLPCWHYLALPQQAKQYLKNGDYQKIKQFILKTKPKPL